MTGRDSINPSSVQAAVFVDGIRAALKEDPLFFVFKYHISLIRELTEGLDDELGNELIKECVSIIQEACQDNVKCPKCRDTLNFRHCQNPGTEQKIVHVVELACTRCGDVFTLAENRDRISYFHPRFYKNRANGRKEGRRLSPSPSPSQNIF
ncbi:hypothetical protein [Paenibacillus sp. UNC451MF]|uniref:hypothetical protein n=1 Tax=Paenibacillus sp. UNC451MF TaxID=1449063 RepID=UPI0004907774|nr:hypothetical protein [Paenibacillus sp. UNC451MF]